MKKTFRYSSQTKREVVSFCGTSLLLFIAGYIYLVFEQSQQYAGLSLPILLLVIFILVKPILNVFSYKMELHENKFYQKTLFSRFTLTFDQIKGYEKTLNLKLIHTSDAQKNLSIPEELEPQQILEQFIIQNFEKITTEESIGSEKIHAEIFQNPQFGHTVEKRQENLKKTKKQANQLQYFSQALFLYAFLFIAHAWVVTVSGTGLLLVLWFIYRKKGLASLALHPQSIYPSYAALLWVFTGMLMLHGIFSYNLLYYHIVWNWAIPTALVFAGLAYWAVRRNFQLVPGFLRLNQIGVILIASLVFGYYGIVGVNCVYDYNPTYTQDAIVASKEETGTSYDAEVVIERKQVLKLSVGSNLYQKIKAGDHLKVYIGSGAFNIPWVKHAEKVPKKK